MIDFSKIGRSTGLTKIEPRDIFMSLPAKSKQYEYPRDVQSEVWKRWFDNRTQKNSIIKMNTGSGKTVVGLTILQSCLAEGKGPAVYVSPDNYLVEQVCTEAAKLGIEVVKDENDYNFLMKKSILVINIHSLVNGMSKFGMRSKNNIDIGSILIDDVHACLGTIENQYTVKIPSTEPIYEDMIKLFKSGLQLYSEQNYQEIVEFQDPTAYMLVPFWLWQSKIREIRNLLNDNSTENYIKFNLPLIYDCLETCNCMITSRSIEVTPKCIPISKINSFEQAKRRIFMSATLFDDSVFTTAMGLKVEDLSNIITPEKANDIGDRLLIFPQVINHKITDIEIKVKLAKLSKKYNVVVIVPSRKRAEFWKDEANLTIDYQNITTGVEKLKNEHVGLVVFINKYDGIDLPNDACRIIVLDSLPTMKSKYDTYVQGINPNNKNLLSEQIQKIEQGMGRGVRSNNDYCVAVLMGKGLSDVLIRAEGYNFFSIATKKQFDLSKQLWDQLRKENSNPDIDQIFSLVDYSLEIPRNIEWIQVSKDVLSSVAYETNANINEISIAMRNAFEKSEIHQYRDAVKEIEKIKNAVDDDETKGFLMQIMAEYMNLINVEEAQQILLSALKFNRGVLRPISGIQHQRLINKLGNQAQNLVEFINQNELDANKYIIRIDSLLEALQFSQDSAKNFEAALKELSFMLGIVSSRPEFERGKGPDNLWALGNNLFLVIECKNRTVTDTINKHDCNQLNGSINWFENEYIGNDFTCCPIMIHNSNIFEYSCSPNEKIRIITPEYLEKFRRNISKFAESIVNPEIYGNTFEIQRLIVQFKLYDNILIDEYTTTFSVKRN